MTAKQWRLLESLERYSGHGTIEVTLDYGEFEPDDDTDAAQERAWKLTQFVVGGLMRGLVKKGLAVDGDWGWEISDRGLELLAKRRSRLAPTT